MDRKPAISLVARPGKIAQAVALAQDDAGVSTPVLVPSSTSGGQFHALGEVLAAFA